MDGLISGGLKTGGFKVGFYGMYITKSFWKQKLMWHIRKTEVFSVTRAPKKTLVLLRVLLPYEHHTDTNFDPGFILKIRNET